MFRQHAMAYCLHHQTELVRVDAEVIGRICFEFLHWAVVNCFAVSVEHTVSIFRLKWFKWMLKYHLLLGRFDGALPSTFCIGLISQTLKTSLTFFRAS